MFETEASRDLMGTCIIGEVIRDVCGLGIYYVVVGEQLITSTDIRLIHLLTISALTVHNIDEREIVRVRITHVVHVGVGEQQLVGSLLTETTVQISRERLHVIVEVVETVGKRHRLGTDTCVVELRCLGHHIM